MPSRCTENLLEALTTALSLARVTGLPIRWDARSFSLTLLCGQLVAPKEPTQHCFPLRNGPHFQREETSAGRVGGVLSRQGGVCPCHHPCHQPSLDS